jgi:hypothetical protein
MAEQKSDGQGNGLSLIGLLSAGKGGPGSEGQNPCAGNYMGAARIVGALLPTEDDLGHESQTSGLASRPGALLLDYLRAVLPDDRDTWAALGDWLGGMTTRAGGWHGWYSSSASVLDGGRVAWCRDRSRAEVWGILVDLPGKACASLGERLIPFLEWVLEHGHVTRADFALDDRAGLLTYERVVGSVKCGAVVSRFSKRPRIEDSGLGTWTQYLGAPRGKGACLIRIYNKQAEQAEKGRTVPGPWVRCEFQANGKFGDALARAYFAHGSTAVIGQIARRVRFTESGTGSDKWRAVPAFWWVQFLGSIEPGPSLMVGVLPECTISRLAAYVERQAGPAMATLLRADGGDLARLLAIMDRSAARLRPKHFAALAMAGVSHG